MSSDLGFPMWGPLLQTMAKGHITEDECRRLIDKHGFPLAGEIIAHTCFRGRSTIQETVCKNIVRHQERLVAKLLVNANEGNFATLKEIGKLSNATIWTTNYDQMLEHSILLFSPTHQHLLRHIKQPTDIAIINDTDWKEKRESDDLYPLVYKLHGCVSDHTSIVLTESDYGKVYEKNTLMRSKFISDLATKSVLFIGSSFSDLDVRQFLSEIWSKEIFQQHYMIHGDLDQTSKMMEERFHISQVTGGTQFERVSKILRFVRKRANILGVPSIFLSGSCTDMKDDDTYRSICEHIGAEISRKEVILLTGEGRNTSRYASLQAWNTVCQNQTLNPFFYVQPTLVPFCVREQDVKTQKDFRRKLIEQASVSIIIHGGRASDAPGSSGTQQEIELCKECNVPILPLGWTGGDAAKAWKDIKNNQNHYMRCPPWSISDSIIDFLNTAPNNDIAPNNDMMSSYARDIVDIAHTMTKELV